MKTPILASAALAAAALTLLSGCERRETAPLFDRLPVTRTTIVVSASAAGVIEPVRTVDVKSKASGEIIELHVETGDDVAAGKLLAVVDPRTPRNNLAQAQADLEVARAQMEITRTKYDRAAALFKSRTITESEYEDARLSYVSANAQVVTAQTNLENARYQMDDTRIVASVEGTIIAKNVELGTVISSPTRDVGGGTVLFTMANLDTVQIRTKVDETDIGKVRAGLPATITVDAYPNRTFSGEVLKIEPQATVEQNVTMFPALVRIANPGHLLMPGMNAEVEIHIGRREDVLAVPYAALRTPRDLASAAGVLGLNMQAVEDALTAARKPAAADTARAASPDTTRGRGAAPSAGVAAAPDGAPGAGAGPKAGREGRRAGGRGPGGGGFGGRMRGGNGGGAGSYIVFVLRDGKPVPAWLKTGLTDLDYMEVLEGVAEGDTVAVLPSASLVNSQQEMQQRIQRMTGGGGIPGMQQQQGGQGTRPRN